MKKVLFLVTALEVGGIETYLLRFLKYLDKDIEVTVLCKSGKAGSLEQDYISTNAKIILHPLSFFSIMDYVKFYKLLVNNVYDAVCDFTGDFAGLVLLTSNIAKVPKRITFYRESKYQFKPTKARLLYAKAMNLLVQKNATKILSNSNTALNEFHPNWKQNKKLYNVIYNGIPEFVELNENEKNIKRKTLGIPENAFIIGHVGRYTEAKNHKQILNVATHILKKYNNVYFLLCGRDVDVALSHKVMELGFSDKILMPGSRNDISEVLQCMDLFYFPSLNEGQPNALLEAMSLGVPVVASNIESIKELFPKDYLDYLVDPNDTISTIKIFENLIKDITIYNTLDLKSWIRKYFNINKQFDKFKNELIG